MILSADQTLLNAGSYTVKSGVVVKNRLTEWGRVICVNFWLPGETFEIKSENRDYDYVVLTKEAKLEPTYEGYAHPVFELERAEFLAFLRGFQIKDALPPMLDYLAVRVGVKNGDFYCIDLPSQTSLAMLIGSTRESVCQTLTDLRIQKRARTKNRRGVIDWQVRG